MKMTVQNTKYSLQIIGGFEGPVTLPQKSETLRKPMLS